MKYRYWILLVTEILFVYSCSEQIAGSKGGSETTNGVTACIVQRGGSAAAGSIVRLRPFDYVSQPSAFMKKSISSKEMTTDHQGRFLITDLIPGSYCIEVIDTNIVNGKGGVVMFSFDVNAVDTIKLGTISLQSYATMTGFIDTYAAKKNQQVYVQVRGLERLAVVDTTGAFAFHDLPKGYLDFRIVEGESTAVVHEMFNVKIIPEDTTSVTISGNQIYSGYLYFNTTAIGTSNVTGFPMLVKLDSANFEFSEAHNKGNDIRFSTPDGQSLSYEIEQWDTIAKRAAVWVRIDTIYGNSTEQFIIMKWGESEALSQSNGVAVFDTALGFEGVWHLNETSDTGATSIKDRTAHGYDGTFVHTISFNNSTQSLIGCGLTFHGDGEYISMGQLNLKNTYTISCWIKAYDLSTARRFIWKEYSYTLWYDGTGKGVRVEHFTDSLVWRGIYQDNSRLKPLKTDVWYFLAGTYDGDKIRLYIDGEQVDSTVSIGVTPHQSQESLSIGGRKDEFVKGIMDEVRIENRARSAAWIKLSYLNQMQNTTIVKFNR